MGVGGFRERKDAIDDGFQFTGGDEFHDRVQLGFRAHVGTEERKLAAEKEAEVDLGVKAGSGATGHQPAPGSEAGEAFVPRGGADVLENDIHAALIRDAADFLADFLCFVIDEVVCAQLFGFLKLFVGAGNGDDVRTEEFRDLNGGAPDAAPRAEN